MQGSHTQWKSCERTASSQGQTSAPLRCTLLERWRRECVRITHCWLADCLLVSHWLWSQCRCFYVKLLWKVSLSSYFVCLFCKTIMAFSDNVLLRHLWMYESCTVKCVYFKPFLSFMITLMISFMRVMFEVFLTDYSPRSHLQLFKLLFDLCGNGCFR